MYPGPTVVGPVLGMSVLLENRFRQSLDLLELVRGMPVGGRDAAVMVHVNSRIVRDC